MPPLPGEQLANVINNPARINFSILLISTGLQPGKEMLNMLLTKSRYPLNMGAVQHNTFIPHFGKFLTTGRAVACLPNHVFNSLILKKRPMVVRTDRSFAARKGEQS